MSDAFFSALEDAPHQFLQPSLPLHTESLAYLKAVLDPLARDISAEQQRRQQEARKKRKRGESDVQDALRLNQLHTDGFGVAQIWEQARRIIDAAREEAEKQRQTLQAPRQLGRASAVQNGASGKTVTFADEEAVDEDSDDELGMEGVDYEIEGVDDGDEVYEDSQDDGEEDEDAEALEDDEDVDMRDDFDEMEGDDIGDDEPAAEFVSDKFGLNDGFFSIDDFNRQSEFLEQQDARGDDDGAASDEEDVDWDADPSAQATGAAADTDPGAIDSDGEDEEDGPTFGDPDALSEDEGDEMEEDGLAGMGDMANTNGIMYADFFAPPAQKKRKNKKGRPNPHNFPKPTAHGDDALQGQEDDMERAIAGVHRDLFDDDEEDELEDDEEAEKLDPADPRSRRSTYERRKAAIAEEIRKLEAANVAKREWMLSGEARAADRPVNSLLEQDMEFERTGKPVPVITAEVSESIEELIKRRILAHDFQDIIRRRPDDLATGKAGKRGRLDFELDDTKSKKGLAEEYEEEHLRRTDPDYVDVKDEKLAKEQKEIEALWRDVCGQLDGLSSWHFRPKPAAPQLDIRVDAPAIAMEDARPSAGGHVATASQLAPQEVYRAGDAVAPGAEVVGKSGLPAARDELTRDEKKRRRRREKERIRNAAGNDEARATTARTTATTTTTAKKTESKAIKEKEMLGDLKRAGVRVIDQKGRVKDVEGREVVASSGMGQGAARYKL